MVKAVINNKLISLDHGVWICQDLDLLQAVKNISKQFDQEIHDYHPQPELQRMEWICEKTKGSILHVGEPDPIDPDVEY